MLGEPANDDDHRPGGQARNSAGIQETKFSADNFSLRGCPPRQKGRYIQTEIHTDIHTYIHAMRGSAVGASLVPPDRTPLCMEELAGKKKSNLLSCFSTRDEEIKTRSSGKHRIASHPIHAHRQPGCSLPPARHSFDSFRFRALMDDLTCGSFSVNGRPGHTDGDVNCTHQHPRSACGVAFFFRSVSFFLWRSKESQGCWGCWGQALFPG